MTTAATPERIEGLRNNLVDVRARCAAATTGRPHTLVAVSKLKPASDIAACFSLGHWDFGENYVQELVDKAKALPNDIRWHYIGALQSNKAKALASVTNLYAVHTLSSRKAALALEKALSCTRAPLRVYIQVNTSGEDAKGGVVPLNAGSDLTNAELAVLARCVVEECPRLRLEGLMTIGAVEHSLDAVETQHNVDFERLVETRDVLEGHLTSLGPEVSRSAWGGEGRGLLLSMGMSSDFEGALKDGSDIVRVGTSIFGQRAMKAA